VADNDTESIIIRSDADRGGEIWVCGTWWGENRDGVATREEGRCGRGGGGGGERRADGR